MVPVIFSPLSVQELYTEYHGQDKGKRSAYVSIYYMMQSHIRVTASACRDFPHDRCLIITALFIKRANDVIDG